MSKRKVVKCKSSLTSKQVKTVRNRFGATLEEAGLLLQVSFVSWCRWEHGKGIDPLHVAMLTLLDEAIRKSGKEKVRKLLKSAAIDSDRVAMLKALVKLSGG